jgi:hypothetical protein
MSKIYFHTLLKLVNMISDFFKQLRALVSRSQKHFPLKKLKRKKQNQPIPYMGLDQEASRERCAIAHANARELGAPPPGNRRP